MHLILLPGMDGTGQLFGPLLRILPPGLEAAVVAYPPDRPCGYAELLPLVEAAVPDGGEFLILGESFSGPLALLLAASRPRGLRGVILCASPGDSYVRSIMPIAERGGRWDTALFIMSLTDRSAGCICSERRPTFGRSGVSWSSRTRGNLCVSCFRARGSGPSGTRPGRCGSGAPRNPGVACPSVPAPTTAWSSHPGARTDRPPGPSGR